MKNLSLIKNKITNPEKLITFTRQGKMVFTNGCFDIIHQGHIEYLSRAAELGDYMVVGLNSDASVKRLKGDDRPYKDQESRAIILASLFFIDYVVLFEEDTPYKLIKTLKPGVLVKGGDYIAEEVVGYELLKTWGGEVIILDFVEGHSSTNLLNKMKK